MTTCDSAHYCFHLFHLRCFVFLFISTFLSVNFNSIGLQLWFICLMIYFHLVVCSFRMFNFFKFTLIYSQHFTSQSISRTALVCKEAECYPFGPFQMYFFPNHESAKHKSSKLLLRSLPQPSQLACLSDLNGIHFFY